jgi:hypothetical protein
MPHDSTSGPSPAAAAFSAINETITDLETPIDASVVKPLTGSTNRIYLAGSDTLPYWLVNLPRDRWPKSCPEFLKDLSDKNISILATPDAAYERLNWEEAKELVRMFAYPVDCLSTEGEFRKEPYRSFSAPAIRSAEVPGVHGLHQTDVWIRDEVCHHRTTALGRWGP